MTYTCGDCLFWNKEGDEGIGLCKFNPPKIHENISIAELEHMKHNWWIVARSFTKGYWPWTEETESVCGKFKKKMF